MSNISKLILLTIMVSACATNRPPVVIWVPDPETEEGWKNSARQASICRGKAHQVAAQGQNINQTVTLGGQQSFLQMAQSLNAAEAARQSLSAIMEGCMAEAGYRKIVMTQEQYDRLMNQPPAGSSSAFDTQ